MKKMTAALVTLMMVLTLAMTAAAAEETAFTFRNNVSFGMNMDDVMATETGRYEIDTDHTRGGVTFRELEYEHTSDHNVRAELKYLFVGNELVAFRLNYETWDISYEQLRADLTAKYGEAGAVDLAKLGKGIYAVDDDGRLERNAEAIVNGNLMIVLEHDHDDIEVTFIDLNAGYIAV